MLRPCKQAPNNNLNVVLTIFGGLRSLLSSRLLTCINKQ